MTNEEIEKAAFTILEDHVCMQHFNGQEKEAIHDIVVDSINIGAAYAMERMKEKIEADSVRMIFKDTMIEKLKETIFNLEQENTACWTQSGKLEARCDRLISEKNKFDEEARRYSELRDEAEARCARYEAALKSISINDFCDEAGEKLGLLAQESLKSAGELER